MKAKPKRHGRRAADLRHDADSLARVPASHEPPESHESADYHRGPGGHYFLQSVSARRRSPAHRAWQRGLDAVAAIFDALQNGPRSFRWSVLAALWAGLVGGSLWLAAHQPADERGTVRLAVAAFFVLLGMALCAVLLLYRDWEDVVQERSLARSREQGRMSRRLRDMAGTRVDF